VITSGATMIVVAALLFLGGETLRGFSVAILIGIVVGAPSIYITSASALDLKRRRRSCQCGAKQPVDDLP
jgi:preprotein translocase subunit SecF